MTQKIILFGILFLGIISCKPKVTIKDKEGNTLQLEVTDLEFTTNEKERKKDSLIILKVNKFLETNSSSIVNNYWFLCDTLYIKSLRDYNVRHKTENINIHLGKESVTIRPTPGSYLEADGPFAAYKITDDSLGHFHSYIIDIFLTDNFEISDYYATVRFSKEINGVNTVTFKHLIQKDENYLIEEKIGKKNKW